MQLQVLPVHTLICAHGHSLVLSYLMARVIFVKSVTSHGKVDV